MKQSIFAAAVLLFCNVLLAAEPQDYWTGPADAPVPTSIHGGHVVDAKSARMLLQDGRAVAIDAADSPVRPGELAPGAPWLPLPHPGLPGALWIPGAGDGSIAADVEAFYRRRLSEATAGNLDRPLVVYCHKACWLSWNAARRAISFGYRQVNWFPEGVEGWTRAGYPTAALDPLAPPTAPVKKLVVLDLELSGDLGGAEFAAEHAARLAMESERLRADLARTGLYEVLGNGPAQESIDRLKSQQEYLHDCNGCDLDVGRQLHADEVMVAWVNRVSGLILTLTYELHDVQSGQIAARKSYDFRGDSDIAWNHAIDYMVRDLARDRGT